MRVHCLRVVVACSCDHGVAQLAPRFAQNGRRESAWQSACSAESLMRSSTVPNRTAYMRVVAPGGDCSTRIGGFPDDDLGPFSAGIGERFTVYFDAPFAFDRISTDP
jgi:hypothetical protein